MEIKIIPIKDSKQPNLLGNYTTNYGFLVEIQQKDKVVKNIYYGYKDAIERLSDFLKCTLNEDDFVEL